MPGTFFKKMYAIIFSFFIPMATIIMVILSFYGNEELLLLKILPVFLKIWLASLVINMIYAIAAYLKLRAFSKKQEIIITLYFSFSTALFLVCCFIVLFSGSIILGGFHAS